MAMGEFGIEEFVEDFMIGMLFDFYIGLKTVIFPCLDKYFIFSTLAPCDPKKTERDSLI